MLHNGGAMYRLGLRSTKLSIYNNGVKKREQMLNLPQNPKWDIARVSHSTLVNADCFDVFPFIEDKSIDAIICDLPYGTTACKWDSILPL